MSEEEDWDPAQTIEAEIDDEDNSEYEEDYYGGSEEEDYDF
jgi:hypothetical protein